MNPTLITAAGLGAVTGLRSMTGIAAASRELAGRGAPRRVGTLRRWLARDGVAGVLSVLAAGELVVDKLQGIPARTEPGPLTGRAVIGSLLGSLAVADDRRAAGAVAGAVGALAGAYLGWRVRRDAGRATALPDLFIALAEDTLAVRAAAALADRL